MYIYQQNALPIPLPEEGLAFILRFYPHPLFIWEVKGQQAFLRRAPLPTILNPPRDPRLTPLPAPELYSGCVFLKDPFPEHPVLKHNPPPLSPSLPPSWTCFSFIALAIGRPVTYFLLLISIVCSPDGRDLCLSGSQLYPRT